MRIFYIQINNYKCLLKFVIVIVFMLNSSYKSYGFSSHSFVISCPLVLSFYDTITIKSRGYNLFSFRYTFQKDKNLIGTYFNAANSYSYDYTDKQIIFNFKDNFLERRETINAGIEFGKVIFERKKLSANLLLGGSIKKSLDIIHLTYPNNWEAIRDFKYSKYLIGGSISAQLNYKVSKRFSFQISLNQFKYFKDNTFQSNILMANVGFAYVPILKNS
jgi:hypothetical protein